MPKLPFPTTAIEFLLDRRYPIVREMEASGRPTLSDRVPRRTGTPEEVEAYRAELESLPPSELTTLHEAERLAQAQEAVAKAEAQEQARFFHQPSAAADIEYWSKAAYWKLDEAIALCLGKEPRVVTWERMQQYKSISPFVEKFVALRELAQRAKVQHILLDSCPPGRFLGWAKQNDIAYPEELEQLVVARGNHVENWKLAYDALKTRADQLFSQRNAQIEMLELEVQRLKLEMEGASNSNEQAISENKDGLKTRERNTLLKLTLGMAMAYHGFDPKAVRSSTAKEIASELIRVNLPLDEDTIRKWLREAAEQTPEPLTE